GIGVSGVVATSEQHSKRSGLMIALAFFTGIVVNLTVLGALAGHLGAVLTENFGRTWALLMAIASLLAAALATFGPRLRVKTLSRLRRPGLAGAFGYGFIFSLGTSAAPLLLLLTVSAAQAEPLRGALIALVFGIGRGLPFLLLGVFAGSLMGWVKLGRWRRVLEVISGLALVFVSFYFFRTFWAFI
ncbi:MAG: cytochrome c biogenesis CcdA family protein, partial [Bradymonadaceae bacterium]